jgi:putative ABC transport system permease protein
MGLWSRSRALLRNLLRRSAVERDLDADLASYLADVAEERARDGLDPEAARRAAALEMGSLEAVKEAVRDARAGALVEGVLRDVAQAFRQLRRDPGLAAAVVLSLGLAIGANTAVFSVVRAVLLEPLPYRDPDRLQMIWSNLDKAGYARGPISGPELQDLRQQASLFQGFASVWSTTAQIGGDGPPEQLKIALVTANFFSLLGVAPKLGRDFLPEEEGPSAPAVAILSYGLWQRRFGSDPSVVGRQLRLDGRSLTVVGVAPAGLRLWLPADASVPTDPQLIAPFPFDLTGDRAQYYLRTLGRLRDGASQKAGADEIAAIGRRLEAQHAEYAASGRSFYGAALEADATREVRPTLLALLAAVALVLLLACVNVASLLVGRDLGRRGQMAVRAALGATRARLIRQALVETLVLVGLGVAAGLLLGLAGLRALMALRPPGLERFSAVRLDPALIGFGAGLGLLAALVVAAIGVAGAFDVDLASVLRSSGRGAGAARGRLRRGLVAAEVALGALLLVGAGLAARSVLELGHVDPGFDPRGVQTFRIALPPSRYPNREAGAAFARRLDERLRALPGVAALGTVSALPFDALPNWSSSYVFDGMPEEARGAREADARAISPGYLAAVGAHLVAGRDFDEADGPGKAPVVIVDEHLAQVAWPGREALGRRLQVDFVDPADGSFTPTWATVVGVVKHVRHRRLQDVVREQVYVSQRQSPRKPHAYALRASGDPAALMAAVRHEVKAIDPELPVYDARPLEAYVGDALAQPRFAMRLAGCFAGLALLVAAIGIYGVVAHSVTRRRREIGVRLALGAATRDVLRTVLGEGLGLALAGLAIGLTAAAALTQAARGLLFGVGPRDPATYAAVAGVLAATALAASALPAWRAARTDPTEVLRAE